MGGGGFGGFGGSGGSDVDGGADGGACAFGQKVCFGTVAKTCDGKGGFGAAVDCAASGLTCADTLGCVACTPLEGSCTNGAAEVCDATGTNKLRFACDPTQGLTCDPDGCHGPCSPAALGTSSVGCDFFPTVTANPVWRQWFSFAVAVANTSSDEAHLTVTRGTKTVATTTVPANGATTIELPWIDALKGADADAAGGIVAPAASVLAKQGAYRLRSDRPIAAWQFSPLGFENTSAPVSASCQDPTHCCPDPHDLGRCYAYSGDATLLLPANALGGRYVVTGWQALHATPGASASTLQLGDFVAITATEKGTVVEVTPSCAVLAGTGFGALAAGQKTTFALDAGDVLELFTPGQSSSDGLSGTRIATTDGKAIQVVSGVPCVQVPSGNPACSHVEESVLPVEALGSDYVVTVPTTPGDVELHSVRIVAIADGTKLDFDPPSVAKSVTLDRGQTLELDSVPVDFHLATTQPVGVTQYMHGAGAKLDDPSPVPPAVGAGSPSQSIVVPTPQFRTSHRFVAPSAYAASYVNVIAPTGATVTLDGAPIDASAFEAVGASGTSVARRMLGDAAVHEIHGDAPIGIVVYGYGTRASYMMPGGLELKRITTPPAD